MRETALVVMAAGIGSRYGSGIKQLARVGPHGEIILDYSVSDALKAGFDRIVFIIRKDIEADFREIIGKRVEKLSEVDYVFQELSDLPEGFRPVPERSKPWGTAQAVWAARDVVDCPFLVINADDFYGAEAFDAMHGFLAEDAMETDGVMKLSMAGYVLGNTLSRRGTVSRGICSLSSDGFLQSVTETYGIFRGEDGLIKGFSEDGTARTLAPDTVVSMNMWGLVPGVIKALGDMFPAFLSSLADGGLKEEFLLPKEIDTLVRKGRARVKVIPIESSWYGVTYKEDVPEISRAIMDMNRLGKEFID